MVKFASALLAGLAVSAVLAGQADAAGKKIGVSWWSAADSSQAGVSVEAAVKGAGDSYVAMDAQSSAAKQLADLRSLVEQGVDALIVKAGDAQALAPAIDEALAKNIPMIAYGSPLENAGVLHVGFDENATGRLQADAVFDLKPEGSYAFIKGATGDAVAERIVAGQMEGLVEPMKSGAIRSIAEIYSDGAQPNSARRTMEQILTANDNQVEAVFTTDDTIAGGVVQALEAQGLDGPVAVAGQGGSPEALNRIALGTQAVTVFQDVRELGKAAGRIATGLAGGETIAAVAGVSDYTTQAGTTVKAVLVPPTALTRENLKIGIDAGLASAADVCEGVAPGALPACP